jgi:hypothetical protein
VNFFGPDRGEGRRRPAARGSGAGDPVNDGYGARGRGTVCRTSTPVLARPDSSTDGTVHV